MSENEQVKNEKQGKIRISSENMMPIIKKWLYSDKDIFLREIVANGVDAITKYKKLVEMGEVKPADDSVFGRGRFPAEIRKGFRRRDHRAFRTRILFGVHGGKRRGNFHEELQGNARGSLGIGRQRYL